MMRACSYRISCGTLYDSLFILGALGGHDILGAIATTQAYRPVDITRWYRAIIKLYKSIVSYSTLHCRVLVKYIEYYLC